MYVLRQAYISYGELCYLTYFITAFIYVYIIFLTFAMYSDVVLTNKMYPPKPLYTFSLDITHPHIIFIISPYQQYVNSCYIMILAWTIGKLINTVPKWNSKRSVRK